jgi:hypothetical protein
MKEEQASMREQMKSLQEEQQKENLLQRAHEEKIAKDNCRMM